MACMSALALVLLFACAPLRAADGAATGVNTNGASGRNPAAANAAPAATAGRFEGAREQIAEKVATANRERPANAPGLYLDAVDMARRTLQPALAQSVGRLIRGYAARKYDAAAVEEL